MCEAFGPLNTKNGISITSSFYHFTIYLQFCIVFGCTSSVSNNFLSAASKEFFIFFQLLRSTHCTYDYMLMARTDLCRVSYFIAIVAVDSCCFWLKYSWFISLSVAIVGYLPKCNFQFNGIFIRCRGIYYCECRASSSQQMHNCTPSRWFCCRFPRARLHEPSIHIRSNKIIVWCRWKKWNRAKRNAFQCISQNVTICNRFFFSSPSLHRYCIHFLSIFAIHNRTACGNLNINSICVFLFFGRCCGSGSNVCNVHVRIATVNSNRR